MSCPFLDRIYKKSHTQHNEIRLKTFIFISQVRTPMPKNLIRAIPLLGSCQTKIMNHFSCTYDSISSHPTAQRWRRKSRPAVSSSTTSARRLHTLYMNYSTYHTRKGILRIFRPCAPAKHRVQRIFRVLSCWRDRRIECGNISIDISTWIAHVDKKPLANIEAVQEAIVHLSLQLVLPNLQGRLPDKLVTKKTVKSIAQQWRKKMNKSTTRKSCSLSEPSSVHKVSFHEVCHQTIQSSLSKNQVFAPTLWKALLVLVLSHTISLCLCIRKQAIPPPIILLSDITAQRPPERPSWR